jgi:hypothetical protein
MKNNTVIIIAIISLALGFGGGYLFKNYQVGKMRPNFGSQLPDRQRNGQELQNVQRPQNGQGPQAGFGGMVMGEIISQDENSITVKIQDGSTKIVILGDSTTYSKSQSIEKAELSTSNQVRVFGNLNSDGSVTAQNVQLNP